MIEQAGTWRMHRWAGGWFAPAVDPVRLGELQAELLLALLDEPGSWEPLVRFIQALAALIGAPLTLVQDMEGLPAPLQCPHETCEQGDCPLRLATPASGACGRCRGQGRQRQLCVLPGTGVLVLHGRGQRIVHALQRLAPMLAAACQGVRRQRARQHLQRHGHNSALARELHDSVAQQLGFLSFQASRLQTQLQQPQQAQALLRELRRSLTGLQRQVRELITNARLTMDGRSLRQALADSLDEFGRRCQIAFELDNRVPEGLLDPDHELQILQIVREALANIVRHSHARTARVELRQGQDGVLQVQVDDDGTGLRPASTEHNHYGLSIMRERAAAIGATLRIESLQPHGTRIALSLACRVQAHQEDQVG
ncbi:sensor histidine kinase [Pseudomonas abieticivorans]|uniref:sensor histidine kinase n=1 Tax=Pseudomonas abieticivorans TaxID=2931382 RepID=UPI0020BEC74F|nr:ATP-binding protein [Pseudomonas sp. PIA16]